MEVLKHLEQEVALRQCAAPRFEVRLAKPHELDDVFRLRYRVFFEELGATGGSAMDQVGMDIDDYDPYCDHLVVTDRGRVIGTYRLLPLERLSSQSPCYSQLEFDVSNIRRHFNDSILELGRTCVEPAYRNGTIAALLWSGIASYLKQSAVTVMFGCVSIHGVGHSEALAIEMYFRAAGFWDSRFDTNVQERFRVPAVSAAFDCESFAEAKTLIPSLLNGYLTMGAKICGGPAYDAEFHCHDYLIMLEAKDVSQKRLRFLERMASSKTLS